MLETKPQKPAGAPRRWPLALLGLAVAVLVAAVVAGCGSGVPSDAVANVDGDVITKRAFEHWLGAASRSQQAQPGAPPMQVALPDPPEFRRCAAARIKAPPQPGTPKLNLQQARQTCKQQYTLLRDQVMQFLISSRWIEKEAQNRGITATKAQVDKMFEDQKRQSFPSDREYRQFLTASGQTEKDLKYRVRLDVLSNKVREAIVKGKDKVSDAEVRRFYDKNKAQFGAPERRDLSVVLTQKPAQAKKARQALDGGQSFAAVAKKFSIDETSKKNGGKLPSVARGQQEKALDQAVFAAKKGQIVGPVRTQFGYYVFRVDKVTPGSQQSFEQARETIKAQLRSQKEQKALTDFIKSFQKDFKGKTNCAKGYTVAQCKNGPKLQSPPSSPGAAQGAPGGAAPQGGGPVPQGGGAPPQGGGAPPQGGAPPSP